MPSGFDGVSDGKGMRRIKQKRELVALFLLVHYYPCYIIQELIYETHPRGIYEPFRDKTLWTLRKVSTRISLSIPHRLTRIDTFCLLWIFRFRNHYSIPLSSWDGMCRPGSVCADCAGWSGSIHNAEMLVFSRYGSFLTALFDNKVTDGFKNFLTQIDPMCQIACIRRNISV